MLSAVLSTIAGMSAARLPDKTRAAEGTDLAPCSLSGSCPAVRGSCSRALPRSAALQTVLELPELLEMLELLGLLASLELPEPLEPRA